MYKSQLKLCKNIYFKISNTPPPPIHNLTPTPLPPTETVTEPRKTEPRMTESRKTEPRKGLNLDDRTSKVTEPRMTEPRKGPKLKKDRTSND
jgi:hypothetical protein